MAIFSVTPEDLEYKAEEARSLRGRYDEVIGEMSALFHAFDGFGENPFVECVARFDGMHNTLTYLSHVLEKYAEMMNHGARLMREAEDLMDSSNRPWACI